jgi:citrate synthase
LISSDHEHGLLLYRGYTLEQLWGCEFEEMFHLLLWGTYPTASQREELRQRLARYMQEVPDTVRQSIFNLPYDDFLGHALQWCVSNQHRNTQEDG